MRSVSSEILTALQARKLVAKDFLWITARDRTTGDPVSDGQWSDVGEYTAEVVNPNTGGIVERLYYGAGGLISVSNIPLVSNITVQSVTITMSQVNDRVEALVRQYDAKQAKVEIHRGLFSPDTRQLVDPAVCRFVGFVDTVEIKTPRENEQGAVILTCKSHTQEMTRSNSDTRSHDSQQIRLAGDTFYQDVGVVGEQEFFWGKANGPIVPTPGAKDSAL